MEFKPKGTFRSFFDNNLDKVDTNLIKDIEDRLSRCEELVKQMNEKLEKELKQRLINE